MARALMLLAFVVVTGASMVLPVERARAVFDLPRAGGVALDGGTVTVDGPIPPQANPGLDVLGFCRLQIYSSIDADWISYFEADTDGSIEGRCQYTEHFFGGTAHYVGTASGTISPATGAYHVDLQWTTVYTDQFQPPTTTLSGSIDGVLEADGYGYSTMNYAFQRSGGLNDVSYGGTVGVSLALHPNLPADLFIHHIEVVQVVQDAQNTVPLVADKNTVVRVFVRGSRTVQGVTVTLTAGGSEISLPALPGSSTAAQANMDRAKKELSFNYLLPANLVSAGSMTLEAEVTGPPGLFDGNEANNHLEFNATFQERTKIKIDYLPICVGPAQSRVCPAAPIANVPALFNTLYPLPENGIIYKRAAMPKLDWPQLVTADDAERLVVGVRKRYDMQYLLDVAGVPDQLAGWAPPNGSGVLGIADAIWSDRGGSGRATYNVMNPNDVPDSLITLSHEVGHNMGLHHSNTQDACNALDPGSDWPFPSSATIQELGWDMRTHTVVPTTKFDMMSYCSPPVSNMWIAPFSYKKLFQSNSVPRSPAGSRAVADYLVISGSAKADGSTGTLDNPIVITSAAVVAPSNPAGNHCIRFGNSAANDYCFNLTFFNVETQTAMDEQWFSVVVPLPANATRLALRHGGTELTAIEKSANAPTVQITAPAPGDSWAGQQTLAWTGSDVDGDDLTYTVLHSADGGATWIPILLDSPEQSFTFDVNSLENGTNGMFKVLATDGLNTSAATVGGLTIGTVRAWGDLRCEGSAGISSVVALSRVAAGIDDTAAEGCGTVGGFVTVEGMSEAMRWGDLQCDSKVDAADALLLLRQIAGLANPSPIVGCLALGAETYVTF